MGFFNIISSSEKKAKDIMEVALEAVDSKNYVKVANSITELWRLRETNMGSGGVPSSSSLLDTVDECVSKIVGKARSKITGINDRLAFFDWMKAYIVAEAGKQASSKRSSIEKEALTFVNSTGLANLPMTMFGPHTSGKNCPKEVLQPILSLLDNYQPELAAIMVVRRFPPPLAGTFMFTYREMNVVRPNYSEKAANLLAFALCWMANISTAQRNLEQIPDFEMQSKVKARLNTLANKIGWENKEGFFV